MTKILLAEDDELVRTMLGELLQFYKYHVIPAVDGEDAMVKAKSEKPEIILTDLIMPQMDGLTLIQKIKDENKEANIIAYSGGGRGDPRNLLLQAKDYGAQFTFAKPVDNSELLYAIEQLQ